MKRFVPVLTALVLAAVVFGCQQAPPPTQEAIDYDAIRAELAEAQQAYADAWSSKDIEFMDSNWSDDGDEVLWGPAERDRVLGWRGEGGIREWYLAIMNSFETIDFKFHDLEIKVGKDGRCAVITYYVENDVVDYDGNKIKMTPRVTVVKEIQDGRWRQIMGAAHFSIAEVQAMQ